MPFMGDIFYGSNVVIFRYYPETEIFDIDLRSNHLLSGKHVKSYYSVHNFSGFAENRNGCGKNIVSGFCLHVFLCGKSIIDRLFFRPVRRRADIIDRGQFIYHRNRCISPAEQFLFDASVSCPHRLWSGYNFPRNH